MAKVNTNEKEAARRENIEQTVSATEKFYNENKKAIWSVIIAIVVIGLGVLAYSKFVYQPKCAEAMQQMFPSENAFQAGEYELALNGDGNVLGFAEVISQYGAKAGKSAYFYAGLCEYELGNYEQAISYLKKYNVKDPILGSKAQACIGDAYVALDNYGAAAKAYEAAISMGDNLLTANYLLKAGLVYEQLGNKAAALKAFKTVKDNYPQALEAYDIDKYISRVAE